MGVEGYVHSIEVGSFVDGPGLRYVVFLAGCPLRCKYCHNPDTWQCRGKMSDADSVLKNIGMTAEFLEAGDGGVTVSGGEPLAQPAFTAALLQGSKRLGLHTALDTSGYLGDALTDEMLVNIDLVLLDIKSWLPDVYRELTGVEVEPTLRLARRLSDECKPMWVRFVLVPGITDAHENVEGLARFVATLRSVERVEVVPFHQMGRAKWEQLGIAYELTDTQPPTDDEIQRVKDVFEAHGLPVDDGRFAPCGPVAARG
ncbi:MAG: pyruvate formate lyase-activating protein [Coriobacteriales bacterium]|nr:pyruvate formate lyase-activating protein [Coriobacteriales bacterium]